MNAVENMFCGITTSSSSPTDGGLLLGPQFASLDTPLYGKSDRHQHLPCPCPQRIRSWTISTAPCCPARWIGSFNCSSGRGKALRSSTSPGVSRDLQNRRPGDDPQTATARAPKAWGPSTRSGIPRLSTASEGTSNDVLLLNVPGGDADDYRLEMIVNLRGGVHRQQAALATSRALPIQTSVAT